MSVGIPLIVTEVGAVSEYINSTYCEIIPPSSIVDLKKALISFVENNKVWHNRSLVAKDYINNSYHSDRMAQKYLTHFEQKLNKSMERHLRADVDVGIFLSGGLDSPTMVKAALNIKNSKISKCQIGFNAFVKKPEYGGASIHINNVNLSNVDTIKSKDKYIRGEELVCDSEDYFVNERKIVANLAEKIFECDVINEQISDSEDERLGEWLSKYFGPSSNWDTISDIFQGCDVDSSSSEIIRPSLPEHRAREGKAPNEQ